MTGPARRFAPTTRLGKWSVGLGAAMPILFVVGGSLAASRYASVPAGDDIAADFAARPVLALSMLLAIGAGSAAFVVGLLAILRQKETGLLVYASTGLGALLLVFLAGEVIFPH